MAIGSAFNDVFGGLTGAVSGLFDGAVEATGQLAGNVLESGIDAAGKAITPLTSRVLKLTGLGQNPETTDRDPARTTALPPPIAADAVVPLPTTGGSDSGPKVVEQNPVTAFLTSPVGLATVAGTAGLLLFALLRR